VPTAVGMAWLSGCRRRANGGPEIIHVELRRCKRIYNIIPLQLCAVDFYLLHPNDGAQQISMGTSLLMVWMVNNWVKQASR